MMSCNREKILKALGWAIKERLSIAVFFEPGSGGISFICAENRRAALSRGGFVFYPFSQRLNEIIFIPDEIGQGEIEKDSLGLSVAEAKAAILEVELRENISLSKDDFVSGVNEIKRMIDSGSLSKVVLSRVLCADINQGALEDAFCFILERYPNLFVSLVYTPTSGLWFTATPERLLEQRGNMVTVDALAGTRRYGEEKEWGKKEFEEHLFVEDYVRALLEESCKGVKRLLKTTVLAGEIEHIKCSFAGELRDGIDMLDLATMLHPTPAVAGFPKDDALKAIESVESHERRYYSGFLGRIGASEAELYVNIRCGEIGQGRVNIYSGAGITKGSDPEKEWVETEMKAELIAGAINRSV